MKDYMQHLCIYKMHLAQHGLLKWNAKKGIFLYIQINYNIIASW